MELERIEKRIEKLRREEQGIVNSCKYSVEAVQKAREKLNSCREERRKLETDRDAILDRRLNQRAVLAGQTPNRAELMEAWCLLFVATFMATWLCAAIAYIYHDGQPAVACLGIGLGLGIVWFPGIAAVELFKFTKDRFAKRYPLYALSGSLLADNFKQARARLDQVSGPGEWAKDASLGCCGVIIIGDFACFYLIDFIYLPVILGFILSVGGLICIGGILLVDAAKMISVECKLRWTIYRGLHQVF